MNYKELITASEMAINKLNKYVQREGNTNALESINQQLTFIRDKALEGKNPLLEVGDKKYFTYRIIASKELSSPEEMEIKSSIDSVSRILDPD